MCAHCAAWLPCIFAACLALTYPRVHPSPPLVMYILSVGVGRSVAPFGSGRSWRWNRDPSVSSVDAERMARLDEHLQSQNQVRQRPLVCMPKANHTNVSHAWCGVNPNS